MPSNETTMNTQFEVGDIVISVKGKLPFELTYINAYASRYSKKYQGKYLHNGNPASANEVIHYNSSENATMETKTLYTFTNEDGKAVFGTHIGTNSENKFIIEVKGTGEILVRDPKDLEEVLPYTFSVEIGGKEIHYIGEPGKLSKGDWLLHKSAKGFDIVQVTAVDTKNKTARAKFNGRRVLTEAV